MKTTNMTYRSKDGKHYFGFQVVGTGSRYTIYCHRHPDFNGQDSDSHKTHIFESGQLCFAAGHEPKTLARARELCKQWAEYFLDYRRTGKAQK